MDNKKKTEGDLTMNNDTGIKYAYEELNKLAFNEIALYHVLRI